MAVKFILTAFFSKNGKNPAKYGANCAPPIAEASDGRMSPAYSITMASNSACCCSSSSPSSSLSWQAVLNKKQTSNTSSEGKITRIPKRTWCGDSVNWATCASVVVSSCSFTKAKFLEPVAETYQRDHSFTNGILVRDLIASDNSGWLMKNPKEPLLCLWTSNKENF